MIDPGEKSYSPAKTVRKAFAILELLGEKQPLRAADTAARLGLSRSNVLRLLSTLSEMGYVEKGFDSLYRLGAKAFILGSNFSSSNEISNIAYPLMKQLSEISQENVNLGVLYEQKVLYLNKIPSTHYLKLDTPMGKMDPLYCTGLGKVLLAGFPYQDLRRYLAETELLAHTRKTIIDPKALADQLEEVRVKGIALDLEEYDEGVNCMAAPIFDHQSRIVAALSLSAPSVRMTDEKIAFFTPPLREACKAVSRKMGYMK